MAPYYLIFDTETTGLSTNMRAHPSCSPAWPRIVQLAWAVYDQNGNLIEERDTLIRPNGYTIPKESTKFHRVTHQQAVMEGRPIESVLRHFLHAVNKVSVVVAHNAEFDSRVIVAECIRVGLGDKLKDKDIYCTMKSTTKLCNLPGRYGPKYPKLEELYFYLFRRKPTAVMHNALGDVRTTALCYFKLLCRHKDVPLLTVYREYRNGV